MTPDTRDSTGPADDFQSRAAIVARTSLFCAEWMQANPEGLAALHQSGVLDGHHAFDAAACLCHVQVDARGGEAFARALRRARNEALFVIAWRDLAEGLATEDVLCGLTAVAEACVAAALAQARAELCARLDRAVPENGDGMVVMGMGKLGGHELNFSSDIDLVFAYRDDHDGVAGMDEPGEYYKRLARRTVQLLSDQTAEGFVYRVDTRLRPFGEAGALAAGLGAMESYYQSHGREWERYAWIKARPIAGDLDAGRDLLASLKPFVYRRYLDYGAFESIREMKALIEKQVARRGEEDNIKTGRGGIREIEFVAQAFQLIRGGHEPDLQEPRLLPALERLERAGHLPAHVVAELRQAYVFLRCLENRLQMWRDRQTHELPTDDEHRSALAEAMGCKDWAALAATIADWRQCVDEHFRQVFAAPQAEDDGDARTRDLRLAWADEENVETGITLLEQEGFAEAERAWRALTALRGNAMYRALGDRGRRRVAQLVPLLVRVVATTDNPDQTLQRIVAVLDGILGRTAYVALLVENPAVLSRLVALCSASPWISRQIEAQPVLLDSLLDPRLLYRPPTRHELESQLSELLAGAPEDDLEQRMDLLRRFQHEQTLRVAAADVSNSMPLMIVSDHLTELAEVIIGTALDEAWREVTQRHGRPLRDDGSTAGFAVIGYGKLGGLELGYGSDLDLVFLHEGGDGDNTDGDRPLSHPAFFMRLAQRVIHLLSTQTRAGRAYEVDTRLRPSGRSGLLVVGVAAYEQYQMEKAWTWEHQALVRARHVAGDAGLGDAFRALRARVLGQRREASVLRGEVRRMRERMRRELDRSDASSFDLKQGRGGLIDIEFIAQYAALLWSCDCEELLLFTDTIRIIETLESAQLLPYEEAGALTAAYRAYRRDIHDAALQEAPRAAPADAFEDRRKAVTAVWKRLLEDPD